MQIPPSVCSYVELVRAQHRANPADVAAASHKLRVLTATVDGLTMLEVRVGRVVSLTLRL